VFPGAESRLPGRKAWVYFRERCKMRNEGQMRQ